MAGVGVGGGVADLKVYFDKFSQTYFNFFQQMQKKKLEKATLKKVL